MTNQEAITIIGNLEDKDILYNPCDVQDAKTMAITALEQEPSGDLISRQATLNAIIKELCIKDESYLLQSEKTIYNVVKKMPPVNPQEPKTGHWIWCVGSHKCSNCEEYTCFSHKELLRYCPNCGCRMIEPQKRSETE